MMNELSFPSIRLQAEKGLDWPSFESAAPNVDQLRAAGLLRILACFWGDKRLEMADLKIIQDTYLTRTVDSIIDMDADDTISGISTNEGSVSSIVGGGAVFGNREDRFS
jgi:hypothetical protein